ncbi:putative ubiquitin-conjugating enzyme E2 38 isoform X2 [Chrysoperla carnea]|uniref:putative ubiquitin-conjugating enzyme E2 38 isoform X2 n=1 Tax=Chrysoperla carnea TaxID=189513 RepID=UPI001D0608B0|nr:putative ubiquitin-conjugating enzyme E2 38 isoform X2 [Chrysoperla carnea]
MHCYFCNGFYSPSYGEPVCSICHAFLFPDFLETHVNVFFQTQEIDDGDSGNDEPTDPYYSAESREHKNNNVPEVLVDLDAVELPPPSVSDENSSTPVDIIALPTVEEQLERMSTLQITSKNSNGFVSDITCLPPEVMLTVLSYLDELSLWSVGNVCRQWRKLLDLYMHPSNWGKYTVRRWPLFKPFNKIEDWFETYSNLIRSSCCLSCIRQMALQKTPNEEENHWRRNRLRSELKLMRTDPPEGIQAMPLDQMTCCHWQATIKGPTGSPYEGGLFYLYIQVPYSYPMCPPIVRFLTKIFHPNISRHGDIGIDAINHNWSLALTICKVLISIQSLLTDPYTEVSMEPDIAKLYETDRQAYEDQARIWTWKYAMNEFYISTHTRAYNGETFLGSSSYPLLKL